MRRATLLAASLLALSLVASPALAQDPTITRDIAFSATAPSGGVLVVPLGSAADLDGRASVLSADERAAVGRALASARFGYGAGQTLSLRGIGLWDQILLIGVPTDATEAAAQRAGVGLGRSLTGERGAVSILTEGLSPATVHALATGFDYGDYAFDRYVSSAPERDGRGTVTFIGSGAEAAQAHWSSRGEALSAGLILARDLSNEPANILYPETFVERTRAAFSGVRGVSIEVLEPAEMERLGMGALLAVGRGSERPPRMMIVRYRGQGSADQPLVLIGKGVTFDTGGISIKPSAGMENMRTDMSGAASVMGAVLSLARQGADVHVVAVAPLAENMPDGAAFRPGDILTAMNGRTIEVLSTDAEGRLLLVDAIAYSEAHLDPAAIVDIATLTGAVVGALGDDYAGLFANDESLAQRLSAAGDAVGERLWRLPLDSAAYATETRSSFADIANSGGSPGAGTGAHFIASFLEPGTPWAHLDIAGVSRQSPGNSGAAAPGSVGYGVRLLERFALDWSR